MYEYLLDTCNLLQKFPLLICKIFHFNHWWNWYFKYSQVSDVEMNTVEPFPPHNGSLISWTGHQSITEMTITIVIIKQSPRCNTKHHMGIIGMTVVVLFNTFPSIGWERDGDIFTTYREVSVLQTVGRVYLRLSQIEQKFILYCTNSIKEIQPRK